MRRQGLLVALVATLLMGLMTAPAQADRPMIAFERIGEVTSSGATFYASANTGREGFFAYRFEYCVVGECPNGTVMTDVVEVSEDDGDAMQKFSETVTGLRPSTLYRVTLRVGNDTYYIPEDDGDPDAQPFPPAKAVREFRTAPVTRVVPTQAATDAATGVSPTAATLNAGVVPGNGGSAAIPASVWFEWGEAGGPLDRSTARQSVPAGGEAVPVSASLTGLTPDRTYTFRVVAERNGSRVAGATRHFLTRAGNCPGGSAYDTIVAGRVQAAGCFRADGQRQVAEGEVLLNGLKLTPVGGGSPRFTLDRPGRRITATGTWNLGTSHVPTLYRGSLDVRDVDFQGGGPLLQLGADRGVELFDLPLAGRFSFTPKAGGGGQLGMLVGIPIAGGGVTGETEVGVTPGGDLQLDGLDVEVGEVNIGVFALEQLAFRYERASDLWRGAARFTLPTATKLKVGVSVTVVRGRFNELTGSLDNINRHIAKGVFLQSIGVLVGVDPLRVGGSIGLSAGPKIGGIRALGLDGSFAYRDAWSQWANHPTLGFRYLSEYPPSLTVGGTFSVVEVPIAQASASFYFTHYPWFEYSGTTGFSIKSGDFTIMALEGGIEGSIRRDAFHAAGKLKATLWNIKVAEAIALLNQKGVSACGSLVGFQVGAYQRWGGSNGVFWACSMEQVEAHISAHAVQDGGGTVRLDDDPQGMIRLVGKTAPPEVRLTGAGGRTIAMPPAGQHVAAVEGSHLVIRDPSTNSTYVLLHDPGSRAWRYELLPGSSAVRSVQTAGALPKPRVRATVRRQGRKALLRWRLRRIPGQRVTFTEEGKGVPPRVIARTRRARGVKRYRPFEVPTRTRTIVATIEQDGRPRDRVTVGSYKAAKMRKPARPRGLRAVRKGKRVTVRWRPVAASMRYDVLVTRRDGSRELERTRRPRLRLRGGVKRVRVQAVGFDGKPGRAATARVRRR